MNKHYRTKRKPKDKVRTSLEPHRVKIKQDYRTRYCSIYVDGNRMLTNGDFKLECNNDDILPTLTFTLVGFVLED